MTVGRARAILSTVWVVLSIPLIAIVFLQTIHDNYEQWDIGFGWLIPLIFPVLSFIFATWTVAETQKDKIVMKNSHVFYLSLLASIFYLSLLYVVVGTMPREADALREYVQHKMTPSSWYLGFIQAVVVVLVGKFFLEHIPEEDKPAASPKSRRRKKDEAPKTSQQS
jgi:hypothetical protein